jgi:multiple sugar transport system substrate-binding protein
MTWDHDRGIAPLVATAEAWHRRTGVTVSWDARSLKDFGEVPLADLVDTYDLLVIDHPFVARAAAGLALPLDDLVGPEFLAEQARGSIGGSHESYIWDHRQYALAIDVAAQVLAARLDLLAAPPPRSWPAVLGVDQRLGRRAVGLPLNPTDVVPTFLSLCGALGRRPFTGPQVVSSATGLDALDLLRRLAGLAVPWTLDANPIQVLERMAADDEVAVVPLLFGYTNYSRPGYRKHVVTFHDVPGRGVASKPRGGTLGGAGLAVSAHTAHRDDAVAYARFVAAPDTQAGLYVRAGGQPAHRAAWEDPEADDIVGGFFTGTRATMNGAFVRPRHARYLTWQDAVGPVLAEFARHGRGPAATLVEIERLWAECRPDPA